MKLRKIYIYTAVHFVLAVVSSFLLFGVVLGFGFNLEKLGAVEYTYGFVIAAVAIVFTFPVWCLTLLELPSWFGYLIFPLQLLVSFLQVNIVLFLWRLYAAKKQNT